MRMMKTAGILMAALLAAGAQARDLPRVMSLNLCADAYLMAFADKTQIAALTPLSRDAGLSAVADKAQNYPVSDGQIEAIIELQPDIIIVSNWSDPMRNALIKRLGFTLLVMDAAQDFASARDEILKLGQAIKREAQAEKYLAQLDEKMAALTRVSTKPFILPLQRRNLTVSKGHILDEIIALAGGANLGRENEAGLMRRVSLENAIAAKADYILVNENAERPDSRGMEFLTHPALRAQYGAAQTLHIDNNLLVCAGATTPLAVAALIEQLEINRD
jgi:iron complex transport system substrate-binding protein